MKNWKIRKAFPKNYLKDLNEPDLIRQFLFNQGVKTKKEAEVFLRPDYERDIGNSLKILNMPRAVKRILEAVKKNEKIIIFGDYDADGVSGSVIISEFFKKICFKNFDIYIPDRHREGYGLTVKAIDVFIKDKVNLIITIDCGITDVEEVKKANKAGIDVIIADHHLVPDKPPSAFTIVDLHQKNEEYPFKYFSGAGLAFKLVKALIKKGDFNIEEGWEKWILDIVAIATIADMVPLLGENRVFTRYGLIVLKKTRRLGLLHLYKILKLDISNITEDDVAFLIAPRINTASRMSHATTSFKLLTTDSPNEAEYLAKDLEKKNNKRKELVLEILDAVEKRIKNIRELSDVLVVGDENWQPGVVGLSSNRLMEKYLRPVFVWGKGDAEHRKGSCRSDGTVNLVDLMNAMPKNAFIESGGHAMAAGFTLKDGFKEEDFEKEIQKAFKKVKRKQSEFETLWIERELTLADTDRALVALVEKLSPFGKDNPKPVFLFSNIEIFEVKEFGNGGIHLELKFKKPDGKIISAIGFFMQNGFSLEKGSRIDLAASIEKSTFKGYDEIRLRIVDIKINS